MNNKLLKQLHDEVYEVLADNEDLNDEDLIKNRGVIIDRLQNILILINNL